MCVCTCKNIFKPKNGFSIFNFKLFIFIPDKLQASTLTLIQQPAHNC